MDAAIQNWQNFIFKRLVLFSLSYLPRALIFEEPKGVERELLYKVSWLCWYTRYIRVVSQYVIHVLKAIGVFDQTAMLLHAHSSTKVYQRVGKKFFKSLTNEVLEPAKEAGRWVELSCAALQRIVSFFVRVLSGFLGLAAPKKLSFELQRFSSLSTN